MVHITPFEVTAWVDQNAHGVKHDLAGSVCAPLSIKDIIDLSRQSDETKKALDFNLIDLDYNSPMKGGNKLRDNLAALYSRQAHGERRHTVTRDNILTCNAGIDANHIVIAALIGPTDHVICHYPTYQQLYEVPRSLSAEVSFWGCEPANDWKLDVGVLKSLLKNNTKMIILNVPNNPSGAIIPQWQLEEVIGLARERGIIVFCDEAFRPLFHGISSAHPDYPTSIVNLGYEKVVVTGTMSKAFSLPGIRAGWIASLDSQILSACFQMRYYTTTTVSQLDEAVASEALDERCVHEIMERNLSNCISNVQAWQKFIDEHKWACSWVRPIAGTTAMVKFHRDGRPVDDVKLCLLAQEKADVCLIPGRKCFGDGVHFEGHVRIGVGLHPTRVREGLSALAKFMKEDFVNVPF